MDAIISKVFHGIRISITHVSILSKVYITIEWETKNQDSNLNVNSSINTKKYFANYGMNDGQTY